MACTGGRSESCNADSNTIRDLVYAHGDTTTVRVGDAVGPLNAGSHTTIFDALAQGGTYGDYVIKLVD